MLSALRGNPKITHLLKGDLPESEQRIREAKTRLERNLRRAFTVSASRMLTFTDGMVSAIPESITRYQLYKAFVKDWYKKRGIPFTGRDVQRVVEQISAPTSDLPGALANIDTNDKIDDFQKGAMKQSAVDTFGDYYKAIQKED